jgi:hypothetical protein
VSAVGSRTVRTFALVVTVIAALTAPALADEELDDGEDDAYIANHKLSVMPGVQVHGTRIGGRAESGVGLALETAYGRGRWQYLAEGSLASSEKDGLVPLRVDDRISGNQLRAAVGMRWIARQFQVDETGGLELFLLSTLGVQRYSHDNGDRVIRPEVAVGFGVQVRKVRRPRFTFRLDARVLFTPNDRESALVRCRGTCMMDAGTSTGLLSGVSVGW